MPLLPALCGDDAFLVFHWLSDLEGAVLEDRSCIAEDEIDCAGYGAISVELSHGVGVKCVLVAIHGASVEDRHVTSDPQGYCLMFASTGTVLETHVDGSEEISFNSCEHAMFYDQSECYL